MAWERELSWCIILSVRTASLLSLSVLSLHQTFHGPATLNGDPYSPSVNPGNKIAFSFVS